MYDDVTVVPLCARMRTAPSRNPLVFKKVFPDGLCAPWAQLPYVPIGKLLTPKSLGRAVLGSDTAWAAPPRSPVGQVRRDCHDVADGLRRDRSRPVLDQIWTWATEQAGLPRSDFGKAERYMLER